MKPGHEIIVDGEAEDTGMIGSTRQVHPDGGMGKVAVGERGDEVGEGELGEWKRRNVVEGTEAEVGRPTGAIRSVRGGGQGMGEVAVDGRR